ncbi:MAG: SMC-Scp complex subunit ScpB [Chitinophagaceae bacterium]
MEISVILPHVEALVFASEKPLTSLELTELINNALGFLDDKITLDQIESAVQGVIEKYNSDFYPFEVRESGGGWQFLTKKDYHKTVAQLNGDKFLKRLSSASLESLAIIAYKQPITKGEVESIRGVNSDYSIQKLLDKELIVITGRNEEMPGKPLVYATSRIFMDYFGINTAEELPMIKEILSSQPFAPTPVPQKGEGLFSDDPIDEKISAVSEQDNDPLVVRANGELIEEPRLVIDEITEVVEAEQVIENDELTDDPGNEEGAKQITGDTAEEMQDDSIEKDRDTVSEDKIAEDADAASEPDKDNSAEKDFEQNAEDSES